MGGFELHNHSCFIARDAPSWPGLDADGLPFETTR